MTNSSQVLFSSFLAGALLVKKNVTFLELTKDMTAFTIVGDIDIEEPNFDFDRLMDLVTISNERITLIKNYDEKFLLRNTLISVRDYLYALTTIEVRNYFNIVEKSIDMGDSTINGGSDHFSFARIKRAKVCV